ncbi:hypothetical protein ACU61A_41175 [Pseudonocardia sichuanensis]
MSDSSERPEWTPRYLREARTAAVQAMTDRSKPDADRVALAVRELAAEVRALRHQLAGNSDAPDQHGALGGIETAIDFVNRRG